MALPHRAEKRAHLLQTDTNVGWHAHCSCFRMTSLGTPQLSSVLLAAVSTTLAACASIEEGSAGLEESQTPRNGPTTPNSIPEVLPPESQEMYREERPSVQDTCIVTGDSRFASLSAGLNPTGPVDYVGVLLPDASASTSGELPYPLGVEESAGVPCQNATDLDLCAEQFSALTDPHREYSSELYSHFIVTDEKGARELTTVDEIEDFVGTIDTYNEAALVLTVRDVGVDCARLSKEGRNYVTEVMGSVDCIKGEEDRVRVTLMPDGTMNEELIEQIPPACVEGRLTEGVYMGSDDPHAARTIGEYLSGVCQLESAAVAAFMQLANELERHGAPRSLVQGAVVAAAEEIEHAKTTHDLAVKAGTTPPSVGFLPQKERSLLEIAKENAAEGCVRELFGAACAHLQAGQAKNPEIRDAWTKIAQEETRHAEWSLALDGWLKGELLESEWVEVQNARKEAVAGLRASTRTVPCDVLTREAGVPTAEQVGALLDELSPLFA